jgi:hypothetical protein
MKSIKLKVENRKEKTVLIKRANDWKISLQKIADDYREGHELIKFDSEEQ